MRILHVVPSYYPAVRYGGPIRSVHGLARALAARGHDVHVYTTNVDGPSNADVPLRAPVNLDDVSVWYFPTALGRRFFRSPDMDRALGMNIDGFDVVHTHSVFLWPTTAAARAARAHDVPYVLAPRGMLVADLIRRKSWLSKRAWMVAFERHNVEAAAAVHATSKVEADEIWRLGLRYQRIIIVGNGAEMPGAGPNAHNGVASNDQQRPIILFLGRVNWKKGLDRLIPAMVHLPEAELVVAGDDDEGYRATMAALAGNLGIASRVRFLGPLHGPEKWALLESARVLALPSYSENFGNVVLEAMALGCPVVVTPEVGLAGVIRDSSAGLVTPGEPELLARALHSIIIDRDAARAMGQAGRKTVAERFTWEVVAGDMERAYQQITSDRKRTSTHGSVSDPALHLAGPRAQ
jgi:glycosyltransferase involved in cell wall biosynthesis